jgi:glyoxylase-like metal-dependent hydrolase (beta-lactamase superfamily II)
MATPKITIGNVEIVALVDMPLEFPWPVVFPGITLAEFEAYRDLYPKSFGEGRFATQCGAYAVRSQGHTVLCDTGVGPGPIQWAGGARGRLLEDMRDKGIDPAEVDTVFFTHLHGDHVGWTLSPNNQPTFPNARHLVPQADWDYFGGMLEANQQMKQILPLEALGVLDLFSGERAVTGELITLPTPGHTPGHTSLLVSSQGEKAIITGDLAHHPAQVERVDWSISFDSNAGESAETRRKVFAQIETEGLVAAFCHFPDPPFGKIIRAEGKRVFQAL